MGSLGQLIVCIATLLSALGGGLVFASPGRPLFFRAGRKMLHAASLAAGVALVILIYLMITHDYRISYVRDYADRTMTTGYLIMSVWGGQEGSLLLWAILQTWFTSALLAFSSKNNRSQLTVAVGFLACLQVFFYCLVLFHSNPFEALGTIASKGVGLNPLLRNPYMAIHPPTLFLGFVGFAVPQAFVFASLLVKGSDDKWMEDVRPWILVAWVFLSVGNILGMVWAYEELGWGGYWGWDPVENASFIPWLTGTALLHSVLLLGRKRVFRIWILVLSTLTFALVVFGTFLTRSGVIASVHAFAGATTGPFLLGLIVCVLVPFILLLFWNYRRLAKSGSVPGILSPEGMFLLANIVFLLAAAFVWFATMAPLFTEVLFGEKVAVTPEFYNKWMVPIGLILLFVLFACVVLGWRSSGIKQFAQKAFIPLMAFFVTGGLMAFVVGIDTTLPGVRPYLPLVAAGLVVAAAIGVGRTLVDLLRQAAKRGGFPGNARQRFGGQIIHLSVVIMFFGFLGSAFTVERTASLRPGESMTVGDYHLKFLGLRENSNFERRALLADIAVVKNNDAIGVLSPARHQYHSHPGQPTSEVVIRTTWREDLFLILGEGNVAQGNAVIRAVVNPLVVWVWIGGGLLVLGTIIALFPVKRSRGKEVSQEEGAKSGRAVPVAVLSGVALLIVVGFGLIWGLSYFLLALAALGLVGIILSFGNALVDIASEFGEAR